MAVLVLFYPLFSFTGCSLIQFGNMSDHLHACFVLQIISLSFRSIQKDIQNDVHVIRILTIVIQFKILQDQTILLASTIPMATMLVVLSYSCSY